MPSCKAALGDMDSCFTLVWIYLFVCKRSRRLKALAQRQSNNRNPAFTDEEVLIVYLLGLIKKRRTVIEIYDYVAEHFSEWFPELPFYQGYNRRLNRLSAVFAPLAREALAEVDCEQTRKEAMRIADSMPIMVAKQKRSSRAKVFFAGEGSAEAGRQRLLLFERHSFPRCEDARRGIPPKRAMPIPQRAGLTSGSEHDLTALRRVLPQIEDGSDLW